VVVVLLCALSSCSDDTKQPWADIGASDGPVVLTDGKKPTETAPPWKDWKAQDLPTIPTTLTAHMEEACSKGLYMINVAPGKETSTCTTIQTMGVVYLQVLLGDNESKPPPGGRSYVVKDPSQVNIYPADGEATAVYLAPAGGQNAKSGTFTVDPHSAGAQVFSGSFDVALGDGTRVKATYLSDFCPFDPTGC
jgi:hypothetical protein